MKICIIGGNVSKFFKGEVVGGAEKQSGLIAREFASRGHLVGIFESNIEPELFLPKRISIVKTWDPNRGISGFRFAYRLFNFKRKIIDFGPDIIYLRGTSLYPAFLLIIVKLFYKNIKFIWGLASPMDLNPSIKYSKLVKPSLYEYINHRILFSLSGKILFNLSDLIVCQTEEQEDEVLKKKKEYIVASNIIEPLIAGSTKPNNQDKPLIWIGKLTGIKGEDLLLALAIEIPNQRIIVVGHVSEQFRKTRLFESISNQHNINLVGRLSASQVFKQLHESSILIHTGEIEGFSNVFLEAWSNGIPVVSLYVNPNDLLNNDYLGRCCNGSVKEMALAIDEYKSQEGLYARISKSSIEYVKNNHFPKIVIDKLENRLLKLIK